VGEFSLLAAETPHRVWCATGPTLKGGGPVAESQGMTIVTLPGRRSTKPDSAKEAENQRAASPDVETQDAEGQVPAAVVQLLRRPRWQTLAACRGEPVEMFIPDRGGPSARAKQLCASCPVQPECLKFALAIPDLVGYWAGTNERERRRLRAARRRGN